MIKLNTADLKRLGPKDDMTIEITADETKVIVRVIGDTKVPIEDVHNLVTPIMIRNL